MKTEAHRLDFELLEMSRQFARLGVLVQFLARGGKIAIVKLEVDESRRGCGLARRVLTEICRWADSAGHALGIAPDDRWGSDVARLTRFYESLGFIENPESVVPFRTHEAMVRYPMATPGQGDSALKLPPSSGHDLQHDRERGVNTNDGKGLPAMHQRRAPRERRTGPPHSLKSCKPGDRGT